MASLCYQLSRRVNGSRDITFDDSLRLFSVAPAGGSGEEEEENGDVDGGRGRGGEERKEEEEGELVDLDESFGFSDSDDSEDVIEMSSDDEEEEASAVSELSAVSALRSQVSELMLDNTVPDQKGNSQSEGDFDIEQLKVSATLWMEPCFAPRLAPALGY